MICGRCSNESSRVESMAQFVVKKRINGGRIFTIVFRRANPYSLGEQDYPSQ